MLPGEFERARRERSYRLPRVAGALGEDEQVAAFGQIRSHALHPVQHQPGESTRGRGREVSGDAQHPAKDRQREEDWLDDGPGPVEQGDQEQRVEVGAVVANHHRGAQGADAVVQLPTDAWGQGAQQTEETTVKNPVASLDGQFGSRREVGCGQVERQEHHHEAKGEVEPAGKGDNDVDSSVQ